MNTLENQTSHHTPERVFIYPERVIDHADSVIAQIKKLESGDLQKINLTGEEEKLFFEFENALGEQMEAIHEITPFFVTIYIDALRDPEINLEFQNLTGLKMEAENNEANKQSLYENGNTIVKTDYKALNAFGNKTTRQTEEKLLEDLLKNASNEGELDIRTVNLPERIQLLVNPSEILQKIQELQKFKQDVVKKALKETNKHLQDSPDDQLYLAYCEILKFYLRCVNEMIMDLYPFGLIAANKGKSAGNDSLCDAERQLIGQLRGLSNEADFSKNFSRIDKSRRGASRENPSDINWKWRIEISSDLRNYSDKIARAIEDDEINKDHNIKKLGLDEEKLFKKTITPGHRASLGEDILAAHNIKSDYPADTYNPKRTGAAPDNKYQYVLLPFGKGMSHDSKQRVIKDSDSDNLSAVETFSSGLSHEVTHALQEINREKIRLRIMKKIGGSRAVVFAEGGAMHVEDRNCQQLFGFRSPALPHYTKAMLKKLEGGDYLDCVRTYFESLIIPKRARLHAGKLSEQAFKEEIKRNLEIAIRAAKRLFIKGSSLKSQDSFLTNSKDTAYLEGQAIGEKLEQAGLQKLLFIKGVGLDDLLSLIRLKRLDFDNIIEYNYEVIQKIWEREKHEYLLGDAA
jgi:hypothetical protein